jgi:hypothetical protein
VVDVRESRGGPLCECEHANDSTFACFQALFNVNKTVICTPEKKQKECPRSRAVNDSHVVIIFMKARGERNDGSGVMWRKDGVVYEFRRFEMVEGLWREMTPHPGRPHFPK